MICPTTGRVIVADIKQAGKPVLATQRCFVTTAVKLMPSEIVMSHVRPQDGHDSRWSTTAETAVPLSCQKVNNKCVPLQMSNVTDEILLTELLTHLR